MRRCRAIVDLLILPRRAAPWRSISWRRLTGRFRHIGEHPAAGSPRYAHELDLPGLHVWPVRRFAALGLLRRRSGGDRRLAHPAWPARHSGVGCGRPLPRMADPLAFGHAPRHSGGRGGGMPEGVPGWIVTLTRPGIRTAVGLIARGDGRAGVSLGSGSRTGRPRSGAVPRRWPLARLRPGRRRSRSIAG